MKRSTIIILAVLLLAFGLRLWNLPAQSIWWDEAFTWQTTSHGLANFWQMLLTGDRNPPLYFVSVAVWGSVAGWSEFSLRFVSVAWSMIGLAFLFNLAKRLYNTPAGLWALALAAIAPALVVYAQEARMYAAFFALTAVTLYFAWRVFEVGDRKSIASFLLGEAGLLLTHYFAIPLVVVLNVFAVIILWRRHAQFSTYARWIAGQALVATPIVLWTFLVLTTPGSLIGARETPPGIYAYFDQVAMLWLSGVRDLMHEWIALPWLGFLLAPLAISGAWLSNGRSTRWVVAFAAVSLAIAYAMTLILTSFHPRYALPYSLPMFVILGATLSNLSGQFATDRKRKRAARGFVGITTALLLMIVIPSGWMAATAPATVKDDARAVAAYLKQHATADDVILVEANDYTLQYYDHGPAQAKMITATTEAAALGQLRDAIGRAQRVWLPYWKISTQDRRGYWPFLLEQSGQLQSQTAFQGYDLAQYALHSPLRGAELSATMADGMVTQRSGLSGQGADGALTFALTWQPPVKFYEAARVSVRLTDARGNTLSARDSALLDEAGRTTTQQTALEPLTNYYVLPIPPGTPPGVYTITAQLYNIREALASELIGMIDLPRRLDTHDPYGTLSGYEWQTPQGQIGDGLTLDAFAIRPQQPWKPMPIDVTLRWRKTGDATAAAPRLRLTQGDRVWAEIASDLLEREYPIGQWVEGETVIDRLKIDYPPVRGPIDLQVGQGDQWTTLTTLRLDESQLMFTPPVMQHTQSAQFGAFAELLGYDLKSETVLPARPLPLEVYWHATNTEPLTTPYTAFTQVLAPDGHLVAQSDLPPDPPTTQWVSGQIVSVRPSIKVVDPAYRGPATLIVGWYNSATVERVPVQGGGDYVTLSVPVRIEDQ